MSCCRRGPDNSDEGQHIQVLLMLIKQVCVRLACLLLSAPASFHLLLIEYS